MDGFRKHYQTPQTRRTIMSKKPMAKSISILLMSVAGMFAATSVSAATLTQTIPINATVATTCSMTVTPVAFGVYDPTGPNAPATPAGALNGTGTISVKCTKGASSQIGLGFGNNPLAGTNRRMAGTDFLAYELYQPSTNAAGAACAYTTVWNMTPMTLTAAPSSATRTYNVCGSVPGGQDVGVGVYTDNVVATINF
jgi:spore coat protein U-like protein